MPPPVHGAAMMGKYIHDSELINKTFNCYYINLTTAKSLQDIGKGGIGKLWKFICLLIKVLKTVNEIKPQLVYATPNACRGAFYKDFTIIMFLKIMKQHIIVHYHNKGVSTRQNIPFDNILYKLFFKRLKVILLADTLYQDIEKYVEQKDVYICPNGIQVKENIHSNSNKSSKTNIMFLSNMMKAKGVWDLVEACEILKRKHKKFHCHFVGKWSDITQKEFTKKTAEYALQDYITDYGAKYNTEKELFFSQTDIFLFPTHNEAFGLVLLEAMEYSIPCIATNEGGIPSIIEENKTGFIIKKHSPEEIADKIEYLMEHPEQRIAMGKAGKEKFLREFTLNKFENRMKDILEDCIASL